MKLLAVHQWRYSTTKVTHKGFRGATQKYTILILEKFRPQTSVPVIQLRGGRREMRRNEAKPFQDILRNTLIHFSELDEKIDISIC